MSDSFFRGLSFGKGAVDQGFDAYDREREFKEKLKENAERHFEYARKVKADAEEKIYQHKRDTIDDLQKQGLGPDGKTPTEASRHNKKMEDIALDKAKNTSAKAKQDPAFLYLKEGVERSGKMLQSPNFMTFSPEQRKSMMEDYGKAKSAFKAYRKNYPELGEDSEQPTGTKPAWQEYDSQ